MIGSLMSRMDDAQKLSVQQLHQAVQSGSLPAYIGVPLIQDKMKQQQMAVAPAPQQPPIAQQIMQSAQAPQQMPPQGVPALQSNLPTEHMAGGGIIAFAGGDLVDDEDEDATDEAEYQQALSEALSNREHAGLYSALPAENNATGNRGVGFKPTSSGIGIKDMLAEKAAQHKLPPSLLHSIAGVESGYKANAANSRSSAKGLFQFTDSTWKGMGGKEGEQFDPEKNAELGARFVRQNAEGLKGALGRNPTYGEVYASHMFGLKGAKDLLNMNPKTPMDQAVSSQVLKANPQLQGKTVGQVMSSLNAKTGEGIVALADGGQIDGQMDGGIASATPYYGYAAGGEVKRFGLPDSKEQLVEDDTPQSSIGSLLFGDAKKNKEFADKYLENQRKTQEIQKKLTAPELDVPFYQAIKPSERKTVETKRMDLLKQLQTNNPVTTPEAVKPNPVPVDTSNNPTNDDFQKFDQASALFEAEQANKVPTITPAKTEAPKNEFDEFLSDIKSRRAGQAKQKSIDSYMALLQAGLGMMSGTSPHALANIGQGAMSGIQNLSESNKLRAAEQANLDKSQYAALRYKELGDINRGTAAATDAQRRAALLEKQRESGLKEREYYVGALTQHEKAQLAALKDRFPAGEADPNYQKALAAIYSHPTYQALQQQAYPNLAATSDPFAGFSAKVRTQ